MKRFLDEDFMLHSDTAVRLYHEYAEGLPIYDYHCHLSPQMMLEDKPFEDVTQIFLGGDHYKWRLLRANGVEEKYITGDGGAYEKFQAFCSCLQYAAGNPLYHWTHLELKRYFGVEETVTEKSCKAIWDKCSAVIRETEMSPAKLINRSNAAVVCTTDDPVDTLEYHEKIAGKGHISAKVLPALRPDKLLDPEKPDFKDYVQKLGEASGREILRFEDAVEAVFHRIAFFHAHGCRVSDHALTKIPVDRGHDVDKVLEKALRGEQVTPEEAESWKFALLVRLAGKYRELGWAMQLHMGALRNTNSRMFGLLGPDTGYDSIADYPVAAGLAALLDAMDSGGGLPKTILYSLNPNDNYTLAALAGSFQNSEAAGRLQLGAAWWFNDQYDGMTAQLKALANLGALNRFVGMLTDSRSFLSYTRHEYFRRILCDLLGSWVERGEFPEDYETLGTLVRDISCENARRYFGFD